jgi:hypothetical protein
MNASNASLWARNGMFRLEMFGGATRAMTALLMFHQTLKEQTSSNSSLR